jgi:hypothetical protein
MRPRKIALAAVLIGALPATYVLGQQSAATKRLSVTDYYYLLPYIGNGGSATRQEKRETLAANHPVIDVKHDYMDFQPDSSPREQLAVFRARGKADVIASSMPDYHSDYNAFTLYRLEKGKLKDVTRQVLPVPARTGSFLYELPRVGTTIRVYRFDIVKESRRHAFDLQWRQGRFIKTP